MRARLEAGPGGYEIVHSSPGLELGVYVLVAPEPDRQQPHEDDEVYVRARRLAGCPRDRGRSRSRSSRVRASSSRQAPHHVFTAYERLSLLVLFHRRGRPQGSGSATSRPDPYPADCGPWPARRLAAAGRRPLGDEELRLLDAYWRAANYLSVGQIYLLDNPLLREPLQRRARQAAAARPLRHDAGPQPRLRAPEPRDPRARPRRDLRHRPRARRPGERRQRLPRGHLQRGLPATSAGTRKGCGGCSGSSRSPAASRATRRPRRPARSTRAASSATRSRTRSAPRSTTPTSSSPASSATARRRPGRSRRAGTRTSSSTRGRDGAVLPILHLNGYKIANPTVLARIPEDELVALFEGYG